MIRIENIDGLPIIGEKYLVPCVVYNDKFAEHLSNIEVPVIGTLHEDKKYFDVEWYHRHMDIRFMTDDIINVLCGTWKHNTPEDVFGFALHVDCIVGKKPYYKEMSCIRQMPVFKIEKCDGMALPLQEKLPLNRRKITKCMRCPHRGTPLNGMPVNDGVVVCPAHGLAFDVKTKEMKIRSFATTYNGR